MRTEQVTIIGAGPAGIAAGIQLKRYGITPMVLERETVGGLLRNANLVENYPGFPNGISGPKLIQLIDAQRKAASLEVSFQDVLEVDREGELFVVKTDKESFYTRILVVASGTKPRKFTDLEIPKELSGKVFHEVYPLVEEKGKHIAIIGGGDAAFDYAINLYKTNRVTILNRSKTKKCLPLLWERVQKIAEIRYMDEIVVDKLEPGNGEGLRLVCAGAEGEKIIEVSYLIGAIGREPNLDFLSKSIEEEIGGLQTSGVLVLIGDVKNEIRAVRNSGT